MISFLAPFALFAAALLAIPVIVHLFKPRKVRRTPFPSLRWLHLSQQKLSRRLKWHQVILFILRAAFIALLVLAAARPVFSRRGKSGSAERFVVLDVSRSMGYTAAGRQTPIALAKEAAVKIIESGVPGDRTAVLLTGSVTKSLGHLSDDPAAVLAALETVEAGATGTELGSALQALQPMIAARRKDAQVELNFITDNYRGSWREGAIAEFVKSLDAPATVRIIDAGVPGAQNAWIVDARLVPPVRRAGGPVVRVQIGSVGDAGKPRLVRVGGILGVADVTRSVTTVPGSLIAADLELPARFDGHGKTALVSIEPADALHDDDSFFLNLDAPTPARVLIVEPDDTQIESMRPAFYLRAALGALSAAGGKTVEVTTKTPGAVTPADFAPADVVMLADVPQLSDAVTSALEAKTKSGAGLAIFVGPHVELTFYNTRLFRPLLPSDSLLPGTLTAVEEAPSPPGLESWNSFHWSHPLLAPLNDPVLGDLPQASFRTHYTLASLPPNAEVLASYSGRAPAIVDRAFGAGRVVLFNTTANDVWGDLPRRKSFVPLLDRLLEHLAGGAFTRQTYEAGQSATIPLPNVPADAAVTVTTPDGKRITPQLRAEAGRTVLYLEELRVPGVYRIQLPTDPAAARTFVVQSARADSPVTLLDAATLRKWWEPAPIEIVPLDTIKSAPSDASRMALWPSLVAAACLIFLAEMFLVHGLCPRMNPGVVSPVVPRRAILRSGAVEQEAVAS